MDLNQKLSKKQIAVYVIAALTVVGCVGAMKDKPAKKEAAAAPVAEVTPVVEVAPVVEAAAKEIDITKIAFSFRVKSQKDYVDSEAKLYSDKEKQLQDAIVRKQEFDDRRIANGEEPAGPNSAYQLVIDRLQEEIDQHKNYLDGVRSNSNVYVTVTNNTGAKVYGFHGECSGFQSSDNSIMEDELEIGKTDEQYFHAKGPVDLNALSCRINKVLTAEERKAESDRVAAATQRMINDGERQRANARIERCSHIQRDYIRGGGYRNDPSYTRGVMRDQGCES